MESPFSHNTVTLQKIFNSAGWQIKLKQTTNYVFYWIIYLLKYPSENAGNGIFRSEIEKTSGRACPQTRRRRNNIPQYEHIEILRTTPLLSHLQQEHSCQGSWATPSGRVVSFVFGRRQRMKPRLLLHHLHCPPAENNKTTKKIPSM